MRYLTLFVFVIFLAGGCANYTPAPDIVIDPYALTSIPMAGVEEQFVSPIVALDTTVADNIYYVDHRQQRLESGPARILFNLINIDRQQDLWVEWQAVFYDSGDFRLEDTGWQTLFLPGGEVVTLKVNSISPQVHNYTVKLRAPGQP